MTDYLWHGDPSTLSGALFDPVTDPDTQEVTQQPKAGLAIIGPIVLDGIAYVNVRTDQALTPPAGVTVTGPELSRAVLGDWAAAPDVP